MKEYSWQTYQAQSRDGVLEAAALASRILEASQWCPWPWMPSPWPWPNKVI